MFSSSPSPSSHTFTGAGYRLGTREEGEASRAPSAGRGGNNDVEMGSSVDHHRASSSSTAASANSNDKLQRQRNVLAERLERRLQSQQRQKPQNSSPSHVKDQKFETTASILVEEGQIGERDAGPSVFSIDDDCGDVDHDIDGSVAVAITSGSEGKLPELLPYPHSVNDESKTTSGGDHNSNEKWMQDFANRHDIDIEALVRRNGCSRQAALQTLVACNGDFQKAETQLRGGGGKQ
mmetsp:Transcript_4450/g.5914  ORF Transcript_4450/g.5914 Transcript_4450/m.5914 type:complete len:236 (+) Transcript_4450:40-747(+)